MLVYEGHDIANYKWLTQSPKHIDQLEFLPDSNTPTENGKFLHAVEKYKLGETPAELVKIYEKIKTGVWAYNGIFKLIDASYQKNKKRKVFKFRLEVTEEYVLSKNDKKDCEHNRIIPTSVKIEVWRRDKGQCVQCGEKTNLHFDHNIPFSKGGSSITAKNIQLLCVRCNLSKHDKII